MITSSDSEKVLERLSLSSLKLNLQLMEALTNLGISHRLIT
jgi:hypothetical protein